MPLTPTDTLADLVLPFFPIEVKYQGVVIKYTNAKGNTKSVTISVNNGEYEILARQFNNINA